MNMRTVALQAGVSSATVSRVINGSPLVREDTANRVRRVIEQMNFIPSPVATTLKYGRSRTYGLIIPDITNPFYPEFLRDFEELLVEVDHEVLLANIGSNNSAMVRSVRRMLMRQVDGAVLMASEFDTKAFEPLLAHKIPLVTIDRRQVAEGISDVAIDFETGLKQAIQHLSELGHRRIAFVEGTRGLRTSKIRLRAFRKGMEQNGLEFRPELLWESNYRVEGGEAAALDLVKQRNPPTAVLTVNDLTAFGVIRGLHRAGLRIPHDMSVVGMDDILLCDIIEPPLTTVRIDRREMAEACLAALEYTKRHLDKQGQRIPVGTRLLVRESTAPPRKGGLGTASHRLSRHPQR